MEMTKIIGTGYARAEHCITNAQLSCVVDTNDEWISSRTGIHTRYVSSTENTSDLAFRAAKQAIQDAKIDPSSIDLVIVATATPDDVTPNVACMLQARLHLAKACLAFDLNAACSGYIFAIQVAAALLKQYHCALIVGAEVLSKIIDWTDRNTCVLFGDGAGACILVPSQRPMYFFAHTQGDLKGVLQAQGRPLHPPLINARKTYGYLQMDGKEIFRFAVQAMQEGINHVCQQAQIEPKDIDWIIPHQANARIIDHVARRMQLDLSMFYKNVNEFGNTSAASIAIALACAKAEGKLKPGMKIVLSGFGGGLSYGAIYLEW